MPITESAESSRLAPFVAFVSVAVGVFVFAGWTLDMEPLTNLVPGWPRMSRLTALAFIVAGAAVWLAAQSRDKAAGVVSVLLILFRIVAPRHQATRKTTVHTPNCEIISLTVSTTVLRCWRWLTARFGNTGALMSMPSSKSLWSSSLFRMSRAIETTLGAMPLPSSR